MNLTCYMCDEIATSSEHAPPRCIFPEQKDLPEGIDYRKNLITVPSCDEHNSRKSTDDEFLLFILVHGYFNNDEGRNQFSTKVLRAWERRPSFIEYLYKSQMPVIVDGEETCAVNIDIDRFNKAISNICRAIYNHEYGEKWMHPFDIISPMLLAMNQENEDLINQRIHAIFKHADSGVRYEQEKGDNKPIFYYKINRKADKSYLICTFVFYGGFRIAAISRVS